MLMSSNERSIKITNNLLHYSNVPHRHFINGNFLHFFSLRAWI